MVYFSDNKNLFEIALKEIVLSKERTTTPSRSVSLFKRDLSSANFNISSTVSGNKIATPKIGTDVKSNSSNKIKNSLIPNFVRVSISNPLKK